MSARPTVQVIVASVRAGRLCPEIAAWVADVGRAETGLGFALLDLADWHLPMDDEPGIPAKGEPYEQPHTRAWSDKVAGSDAFIIVTPQYNWGYPASLKNAIDHLCKEWAGKPVMIVSYGGHGGTKAALQLRQVAEALKMRCVAAEPALVLPKAVIGGEAPLDPATAFADALVPLKQGLVELEALAAEPVS